MIQQSASPLDLVKLPQLMALSQGRREVVVGLADGPVAVTHPGLATGMISALHATPIQCGDPKSPACRHGTFMAGILSAKRGSAAPAICPGCTLLVRPIFPEAPGEGLTPSATPRELAEAIADCVDAGVRVLNLSAALSRPSVGTDLRLRQALDHAAHRGVIVVAAAGNSGAVGGSAITSHPWVLPVVALDLTGRPLALSDLGWSAGRGGLGAPGESVTSLSSEGESPPVAGTSIAAPFVTGAIALLWSLFPDAGAAEIKAAVVAPAGSRRSITPPALDARRAYQVLSASRAARAIA